MTKLTHNILSNITTFAALHKMLSNKLPINSITNYWFTPILNTLRINEYSTIDICTYNNNIYTYTITIVTPKKEIKYSISIYTVKCINSDEIKIHCDGNAAIKDNLKNEIWVWLDTLHNENGPAISLWDGKIKQWWYYGNAAKYLEHNNKNWKQRIALEYFG